MSRTRPTRTLTQPATPRSRYADAALDIARRLVASARVQGSRVEWDGDDLAGDDRHHTVVRGAVDAELYKGVAGIGWFLAHAANDDPDGGVRGVASRALQTALAASDDLLAADRLSLYGGAAGPALAAVEGGARLRDASIVDGGRALARRIADQVLVGRGLDEADLIAGAAGVIIGLLSIHRRSPDPRLVAACRAAGAEILRHARREWWGWSWPEAGASAEAPALCGLGHGASGVGWALIELASELEDTIFMEAAQQAFRYERTWLSRELGGWPDLRSLRDAVESAASGEQLSMMTAWCHGAIGIGAVRLRVFELTRDASALADATAAIHAARGVVMEAGAALSRGEVADVTMCHGLAGAAELFLLAHEILGQEDHLRAARRVADLSLDIHARHGEWTVGLRGAQDVPGLFVGLAGIGATMLRADDPAKIGSLALAGRPSKRRS